MTIRARACASNAGVKEEEPVDDDDGLLERAEPGAGWALELTGGFAFVRVLPAWGYRVAAAVYML